MNDAVLQAINNGKLKVKVNPGSSTNQFREVRDDLVIIDINAQPENDKANTELLKFLRKELKTTFMIKSGKTSRVKFLEVV